MRFEPWSFECCVYKQQTMNPTHYAFEYPWQQYRKICCCKVSPSVKCIMSFLDVDPQMTGVAMDWTTVPLWKNTPSSVVSSPTLAAHSVPVTCTLTPSHFSVLVSMISASTLQPMACCVLQFQPMREPALFWDWIFLSGVRLYNVVCLHWADGQPR